MGKAIIYLRVSTEEQAEKGFSLQAQREECITKANELNCFENLIYCDEGVSGSILERPMLLNALEALKQYDIDYFICYDSSRLSRNVSHQLILIDNIKKCGAKLIFIRSNYEDTAEGRFQLTIMAAVDEYERARIKIRTELGKRTKANQKLLTHNPNIYGYLFDKKTDTLTINVKQAEIVKLIYNLYINDGLTPVEISKKLNELDIPSMRGKLWSRTAISRILKNNSYIGVLHIRRYDTRDYRLNKFKKKGEKVKIVEKPKEQWISISIPAIIEENEWRRASILLDKAKRFRSNMSRQEFFLAGLIKCGICNGNVYAKNVVNSGNTPNRYYCCSNKYNYDLTAENRCTSTLYNAEELEDVIWDKVKQWILNEKEIDKILYNNLYINEEKNFSSTYININALLSNAYVEKERIIKLFQKNIINEKELDTKINEIESKISQANELKVKANEKKDIFLNNNVEILNYIREYINRMTATEKYKILHKLIKEIKIKNNQIEIKAIIPNRII